MAKIVVTRRGDDIHACLEGRPEIWANGKTKYEAIGNLIDTHQEEFALEIEWNKNDALTQRYLGDSTPKQRRC